MNHSKSMIAAAVVSLLPLASFAGDKDKMPASGTVASAQFDALDANRDGRISPMEASADAKIEFAKADKNGDGYLDSREYVHRDMSHDPSTNSVPSSQSPESASPDSSGTSSKSDPNQQQGSESEKPRL